MPVNRIPLVGPPTAYDTFRIRAPISTHYRAATCAEVGCVHYSNGWVTRCDEATVDGRTLPDGTEVGGQVAAGYIRSMSDRRYRERRDDQGLTVFEFEAGQTCFRADQHFAPLERDPLFIRHHGVPRLHVTGTRTYDRPDQWVDDFAEHQTRIKQERE